MGPIVEDPRKSNKSNLKPDPKEDQDNYPFGPDHIELRPNYRVPPNNKKKDKIPPNKNPPYPYPYPNDQSPYPDSQSPYPYLYPNMPNYPQNEQEFPNYPSKRPNSTKKNPYPKKKQKKPVSPAKKSPNYKPKNGEPEMLEYRVKAQNEKDVQVFSLTFVKNEFFEKAKTYKDGELIKKNE